MPIFSHGGRNVLFVHVPKTGGTAIENFFRRSGPVAVSLLSPALHGPDRLGFPCSPQHFHAEILAHLFDAHLFAHRIAVVRHPVDRLASEYRMRVRGRIAREKPFPAFAPWVATSFARTDDNPYHRDNHFRPQVAFVNEETEVFHYDAGLDAPVRRILGVLQVDLPIALSRRNVGAPVAIEADAALIGRIEERYADDMRAFGFATRNAVPTE